VILNYSSHRSFTVACAQNGALGQEPPLISAAIIPEHLAATAWERRPPNEDATYSRRAESVFCGAAHSRRAGPIASRRGAIFPVVRTRARVLLSLSLAISFRERGTLEGEKRRVTRIVPQRCFPVAATTRALRALPLIVAVDRSLRGHPCLGRTRGRSSDAIGRRARAREGYVRTESARFARSRRKRRQSRSARSTETFVVPREC